MNGRTNPLRLALRSLLLVLPAVGCTLDTASADEEDARTPETWHEQVSYALGWNIGGNLEEGDLELDAELLLRGFRDAVTGADPALEAAVVDTVLSELQGRMQAHMDEAKRAALAENTARGIAFLAAKESENGVTKTNSGLLYKVIRAGSGESPAATDMVSVHYRGTLLDGTQFDSSYDRGQPMTFPVSGVIQGWVEALQLMSPGAKWELYIPSGLAYGDRGSPPLIPPGATLLFEVELLEIAE